MTTIQSFQRGDLVSPAHPGDIFPIDCEFPGARPPDGMVIVRGARDTEAGHQVLLTGQDGQLRWFQADHFRRVPSS